MQDDVAVGANKGDGGVVLPLAPRGREVADWTIQATKRMHMMMMMEMMGAQMCVAVVRLRSQMRFIKARDVENVIFVGSILCHSWG